MTTRLDHVGIAVSESSPVERLLQNLLSNAPYKRERIASQQVETVFISAHSAKLELLRPLSPDSPISKFLDRRGEGIHHVAFEVDDIRSAMSRAREHGLEPLTPDPQPGSDGKLIFFLHPKQTHGVLIEFCQSTNALPDPIRVSFRSGTLAAYPLGAENAPPVVLLHDIGGSASEDTFSLARELEKKYRVIAVDFAGHGASDAYLEDEFTDAFFAEQVKAVLEHFQLRRSAVFGFSLGGHVALWFASAYPTLCERLILHATNMFWEEDTVDLMLRRVHPAREKGPGLVTRLRKYIWDRPQASWEKQTSKEIAMPVLLSVGDRDELVSLDHALRAYRALPNANLAVLPAVGHSMQELDVRQYAELLSRQ